MNLFELREKLSELVRTRPKHYALDIKKDAVLLELVKKHSLVLDGTIPEMVYSVIHSETNICKRGNKKKFDRISTGFVNCGPAAMCECTKESISNGVSETKSAIPTDQKAQTNQKRRKTMLATYGVEHNLHRPEVVEKISRSKMSVDNHGILSNKQWLHENYIIKQRSLVDIADELGVYYGTVADYCRKHGFDVRSRSNYSLVEKQVREYLIGLLGNAEIIDNDRKISNGKYEIDIFVPNHKIGIEINGLYWHSWNPTADKKENSKYHADKTDYFSSFGIQIIHITDWQWKNKQEIVKSMLKSKFGLTEKLYARKCSVIELDSKQQREFFDRTHLQGYVAASQSYGLVCGGRLVSAISISKTRVNNVGGHELVRFSTELGHTVVGGFSKLLKYASKSMGLTEMVSYCDRDISCGRGYTSVGFSIERITKPGYFWTDGNNIFSRQKCQKNNLRKWMPSFDESLSEAENMFKNGYRRFWNSGNIFLRIKF